MLNPKLSTLLTAAELGSFTRAANALSLTQPAVSHHIKELEQQLGVTLFLRKKGQIQLTPEGEIVLDVTGRKNGRGAYLCFSKECLQKAIKNKGLERSLKMQIPQEVYENLERELDTIEL